VTVIIAGGSGFLGRALQSHLRAGGHRVVLLSRNPAAGARDVIDWAPNGQSGSWAEALDGTAAVVNLSGAGIADARWTDARKELLRSSRILSTRSLVTAIQSVTRPPGALINASGIGYYGDRGTTVVTEATPAGSDFLARLCVEWEAEADRASTTTRVVILRNGVVLDPSGGALGKMLLPFRAGVGGRLGSGTQYFPWIHLEDWLAIVAAMITDNASRGPFNMTAPQPATNAEFTKALGAALGRPALIPVPAFALRLALGELADTLLTGQRAIPERAAQSGFVFRYPAIGPALRQLVG
jgi:uncharacterized protein (TIGR01777 family)